MRFEVASSYDPTEWDQFVSAQSAGHFMQSYAWGQFRRKLGWEPRYCVLKDGSAIRAAALILARSVPYSGVKVLYAPRGPVVDFANEATALAFLDQLGAHVRRERAIFLRCDPYWPESANAPSDQPFSSLLHVPRDWSSWNQPRFVLWLDLSGDEEAVLGRATSRCRNDVRRGYRNGIVYSQGTVADIDEFFRLMVLTGQHKGIAFHGGDYYRRLYEIVNGSARLQLFVGRYEGQAITAGMSIAYGEKAWLLYAASSPEFYRLRANRAQQWEMIKWAHQAGCARYDFRGSATNDPPSPKDPGFGVYEFKKSFGPEFTRLVGYFDLVRRPILYRALRIAEDHLLPMVYGARVAYDKWVTGRKPRSADNARA